MFNLKEIRIKAGISQQKLAEMLSVSRSTVTMWETNKSSPSNEILVSLSKIFNVSTDFLLGAPSVNKLDNINVLLKKMSSKCLTKNVDLLSHKALFATVKIVDAFLDFPSDAEKNILNFNEFLENYYLLTDEGRVEMANRLSEYQQFEQYKSQQKTVEMPKKDTSTVYLIARDGVRETVEISKETEEMLNQLKSDDDLDL